MKLDDDGATEALDAVLVTTIPAKDSEESAAASEELSSQAISLKNLVEQFKLPEK